MVFRSPNEINREVAMFKAIQDTVKTWEPVSDIQDNRGRGIEVIGLDVGKIWGEFLYQLGEM
ncbi:MAG: hypothetical protein CM1200mP1_11090 [Candidatus Neomarinimicrobiota bacterium]|nr:MAG: hypothetical protein CM1200mP1_11090 [Candidatus Neomarinimicrobiota bacterium]